MDSYIYLADPSLPSRTTRSSLAFQFDRAMDTWAARLMAGLLAGFLVLSLCFGDVRGRSLSLEERVAAQNAIEQVYWNHRIWPKENPGPKPTLSAVLPDTAIRARVQDTLRKSNALEKYWHRPVTATQLQAELNRMAAHTRDPRLLQELFAALGNDPRLIAETLARQTLVDRLIRSWYATDERFHGKLRKKAEAALAACRSVGCMPSVGGEYQETTWRLRSDREETMERVPQQDVKALRAEEWRDHLARLAGKLGGEPGSLPLLILSGLEETTEGFAVSAVLSQSENQIKTATLTWPKVSFDAWWRAQSATQVGSSEERPALFTLPAVESSGCVNDTWAPTLHERYFHTAVWTGTEMIVWGGQGGGNTGGRYDPSTDTWTPTSTGANVPAARYSHTAAWTGTEMIVWGGEGPGFLNTGGRYNPSTDTWTPTSTAADAPAARSQQTAVWTGTEMIVWGGVKGGYNPFLNTGGRYDPSTDTWTPTSMGANVPAARYLHTAVWTGTEMIVWGGDVAFLASDSGGRYDPSTNTWTPTSTGANVPTARYLHTAVWTGTEMIVWGPGNTGGRYDPSTDTWRLTSTGANVPDLGSGHTALWTGTEMIVWGGHADAGSLNTGGRYDPSADTWLPTSIGANVPAARSSHTAVWTGTEMIVWGGYAGGNGLNTGGRYDPSTDTWTPTGANPPAARSAHTAVWTGTEMIVWGGWGGSSVLNTGGRYDPPTDMWTPTSTGTNVPAARSDQTAVWTGTEMIVWGGYGSGLLNSGGRYDPSTDTWTPTSTGTNVPAARLGHTAVWTGTEMIVWGSGLNTGGRYDPSTDTWTPTSTGANVPNARYGHIAVWTGTEMIVWGGYDGSSLNTGGRYDPFTDAWTLTSTGANVPAARTSHTAVWTGTEMIVWGGDFRGSCYTKPSPLNIGGRYDPSTDTWTPTSTGPNVPATRFYHTTLWTGTEMIVWGGYTLLYCDCYWDPEGNYVCDEVDGGTSSGGRYDPSTATWTPTSYGANVPAARQLHTAVWTGKEMMVWGGDNGALPMNTGGIYCACPSGTLYYRDSDADGYGDPSLVGTSCDGTIPAGYTANSGDCNDASGSVHPGAVELCNSIDDNCDGTIDNAAPPGPFTSVTLRSDAPVVQWTAVIAAQTYEVVYGDVGVLRSSGGNFTSATLGCAAYHATSTSTGFTIDPGPGQALWVLVRGNNCAGTGTYDSGDPSQVGSRDAEIEASLLSCTHALGQYAATARAMEPRRVAAARETVKSP